MTVVAPEASRQERPVLVIIQDRETQFDAPLYALIRSTASFELEVIYTTPSSSSDACDDELGFAPQWDHLQPGSYTRRNLRRLTPVAIWRLSRSLLRSRPTLVIICGYYPRSHLLLALFLRLQQQRIGLRSDNTLSHTRFRGWTGVVRRLAIGAIQRLYHTWHPVGDQAHGYLRTLSGVDRPAFRFAYAVDNDWLSRHSALARLERSSFLQQQDWPDQAFVVLGLMKWSPREDPLTLIRAFAVLRQRCPQVRLLLVGDGPLREEVMSACAPFASAVHCPGYSPYSLLPRWYGLAHVFVHPSPDEPWGVSVNEAMACGLPVIAAEGVGAAHELIDQDVNGRVVPNRDPEALAAALEPLARHPDLVRAWGERGQQRIRSWSYVDTIRCFQEALSR